MFWGGHRLRRRLPYLIHDYHEVQMDRASYHLRVGAEVYVSPTGEEGDRRNKPRATLKNEESFSIPAGQFGFILTEETVEVPNDAIALISIRAKYKFQGLVNVSGFHVDPGYDGKLLFSVFNAGPNAVHLKRGEACFVIWYADICEAEQNPKKRGIDSIPSELIGPLSGGLESFARLMTKINDNHRELNQRLNRLQSENVAIKALAGFIVIVVIGLIVGVLQRQLT